MRERIMLLIKLGFSEPDAIIFIKNIAFDAFDAGEECGQEYEPAIIGESLGKSGVDFDEWFENQLS